MLRSIVHKSEPQLQLQQSQILGLCLVWRPRTTWLGLWNMLLVRASRQFRTISSIPPSKSNYIQPGEVGNPPSSVVKLLGADNELFGGLLCLDSKLRKRKRSFLVIFVVRG